MRRLLKRQATGGPGSGIDPSSPVSTDSEDDPREPAREDARGRMASDSTDGEIRSTPAESDDEHHGRIRDGGGSTSPLLLQTTRQRSMQKMAGALGSKLRGTSSGDIREDIESQATAAVPATVNNASRSWKQPRNNPREEGLVQDVGGRGNGGGFGGYGAMEAEVDEGEPLLCEEVADYIGGVDFRDGTGPSALPPNDVLRAFRDAEDFALLGRGGEFWSRLTGDDHSRDHHHPTVGAVGGRAGIARTGRGGGRGGSGGGATGRRRRVVHIESATTGKFFKVYEGLELSGGSRKAWGARGSDGHHGGGGSTDGGGRGGGERDSGGAGAGGGGGSYAEDEVRAAERLGISVREVSLMRLNRGLEAGILLVQGVIAGMTLASMYTMALADSLESFVTAYEAQAGEFRRAMFVLCTLALMGTEDQLMQAKGKGEVWARLGWWGRLDLRVCVFVYGGCLVSSLVCAVADTGIANAYGSPTEGWYVSRMDEGDLRPTILLWYGCNLARFLLAWAGWCLVCRRQWRASLLSDQSQIELKGQREKLSAAEEQISRLNGRNLDPLTTKELQELSGSLKRALDNAERLIGLR